MFLSHSKTFSDFNFDEDKIDDSIPTNLSTPIKKNSTHYYLLIKNPPSNLTKKILYKRFSDNKNFEEIMIIKNSKNIYIKFDNLEAINKIIKTNDLLKNSDKNKLNMSLVNKLPLDLNKSSKIVLVTIYNEKIQINVFTVSDIFKQFGVINKIIIFKKKNYQVFVEFENNSQALKFKQKLHNKKYKNIFFLKIQFTQKKNLIINDNNLNEYDFSKEIQNYNTNHTNNFSNETNDQNYKKDLNNNNTLVNNNILNKNIISSLQNIDFFSNNRINLIEKKGIKGPFIIKIYDIDGNFKKSYLFNLFSLYGQIEKINLNILKKEGFIYFKNFKDLNITFNILNKITLFGKELKLEIIKNQKKAQETKNDNLNQKNFQNNFYNKKRIINKPHKVLYIYNLSPKINLETLKDFFENFEIVINYRYLNKNRNSALFIFQNTDSATRILCYFKNMNFMNKILKINFANNKSNNNSPPVNNMRIVKKSDDDLFDENIDSCFSIKGINEMTLKNKFMNLDKYLDDKNTKLSNFRPFESSNFNFI